MEPVLVAALILLLLLLIVAVTALVFLVYRLSAVQAGQAAAAEAVRRAAEAQVQQARAESDTAQRQATEYIQTELAARTAQVQQAAQTSLQHWREQELAAARQQQAVVAQGEAQNHLAQWKADHEEAIRQDAIARSRAVISGKVTEHFVPYLPDFPFNPKDARFIGSPVDLIVFDGLDEGEVRRVVLIEVKTGSSALSARERRVRAAVQAGQVEWLELRPKLDFTATLTPAPDGAGVAIELAAPPTAGPAQEANV